MSNVRYPDLYADGRLWERVRTAYAYLASCTICPHRCGVNRLRGEEGRCKSALLPKVASVNVHRGEEPAISGTQGSGTVFMSGCTMQCLYCQNFPISQQQVGECLTTRQLAQRFVALQAKGVHNINFVTPTHWTPQILAALWLAVPMGLQIPLVWNTSGFESPHILALLDGIVDIYLPDMKYANPQVAQRIAGVADYPAVNREAIRCMHDQVGYLAADDEGIAQRGMIVRHLVLPEGLAGTSDTLAWIADNLGSETTVSLMSQYFPADRALCDQQLGRCISEQEYEAACDLLEDNGLEEGWVQELSKERGAVV